MEDDVLLSSLSIRATLHEREKLWKVLMVFEEHENRYFWWRQRQTLSPSEPETEACHNDLQKLLKYHRMLEQHYSRMLGNGRSDPCNRADDKLLNYKGGIISPGALSPSDANEAAAVRRSTFNLSAVSSLEIEVRHEESRMTEQEFQSMIKDRILERRRNTEVQRQNGIQRILNMKSREGLHPLQYCPEEIWDKILDPEYVTARDLGNVYEVHDVFQEILEIRKIRDILLPQILMNFSSSRKPDFDYFCHWQTFYEYEDPISRIRNRSRRLAQAFSLPLPEFIRLRGISKSVRNAIDVWFEDRLLRKLRGEECIDIPSITLSVSGDLKQLDEYLNNFGENNRTKRFFLRSLTVVLAHGFERTVFIDEFDKFRGKLKNLLQCIGDQIWRFEFKIIQMALMEELGRVPATEIQSYMKEILEYMPNLKWLIYTNREIGGYNSSRVDGNFEFPYLPKLERICFELDSRDYTNAFLIFSKILKANVHVKMLNIVPGVYLQGNEVVFKDHLNPLLDSLPDLSLKMFSVKPTWTEKCTFECLHSVIKNEMICAIKRMYLGCSCIGTSLKSLFQSLENFQSMEHLTLRLVEVYFEKDDDVRFLKLPNLSHLDMGMKFEYNLDFTPETAFVCSLQFLLFAKKLKNISWKLDLMLTDLCWKLRRFLVNNECHEKSVNFRAGMRDLRTSNVWNCFPELEEVGVDIVYGRHKTCYVSKKNKRGETL